ncbi:hypothetical protein [Candidatus Nitrospira bockiana]
MTEMVTATLRLYREALEATVRSFRRGWRTTVAVIVFAALMVLATQIAVPLGMLGGFLLGAVNALLIGATLSLIEQTIKGSRVIGFQDIVESFGRYFWDVIGVGFVLWVPMLVLDKAMAANPNGPLISAAIFLLLFILLNPAPEVIYQVRHDSPLDVLRESYEFVIENWIEWFLPLALVLAPFGLSFFFDLSRRLGRGAGLDFFQVLVLPFTLLKAWLLYLGLPEEASWILLLLTPPVAVAMLLFRGHLFAALHGSSRRQRLFRQRFADPS